MEPSSYRNRYHSGTCEATSWRKRYGKYQDPQVFDASEHQWHLATDKNWGPWSCCGDVANSVGCCERREGNQKEEKKQCEEKKYIQFIERGNIVGVVSEEAKCWRLDDGRIAKKKTEGTVWKWNNNNRVTKKKTKEGKVWKYRD